MEIKTKHFAPSDDSANRCIAANRLPPTRNNNPGGQPHRNTTNANAAALNQPAYFITDSTPSQSNAYYPQAYMAFSD